jgi:hypothetical protein
LKNSDLTSSLEFQNDLDFLEVPHKGIVLGIVKLFEKILRAHKKFPKFLSKIQKVRFSCSGDFDPDLVNV